MFIIRHCRRQQKNFERDIYVCNIRIGIFIIYYKYKYFQIANSKLTISLLQIMSDLPKSQILNLTIIIVTSTSLAHPHNTKKNTIGKVLYVQKAALFL